MSDGSGPSRRQLLGRLAGVGAVGLTTGIGTHALVTEYESFAANSLQSRSLDLELAHEVIDGRISSPESDWTPPSSEDAFSDANGLSITLDELGPQNPRSLALGLQAFPCDLPAELWLRVAGPEENLTLASKIGMRVVTYYRCGESGGFAWCGTVENALSGSTASETSDCADLGELATGVKLTGDCTGATGGCEATCVSAEWWIPGDVDPSALSTGTLSLSFEFVGRQCTSRQSTGGNPWNS